MLKAFTSNASGIRGTERNGNCQTIVMGLLNADRQSNAW